MKTDHFDVPMGTQFSVSAGEPHDPPTVEEEEAVLHQIVAAYQTSGNPGKFELRTRMGTRFVVVGVSSNQSDHVPAILDTRITVFPTRRSMNDAIHEIAAALTAKTGVTVRIGSLPINLTRQVSVSIGGQDVEARTLLVEALQNERQLLTYTMLADDKDYFLNVAIAGRRQPGTIVPQPAAPEGTSSPAALLH